MKLSLREIAKSARLIEVTESQETLDELLNVTEGDISSVDRGLIIDLRAEMVQNTVLVRGHVRTAVQQPCIRCLFGLKTEVDAPVDAAFFPLPGTQDANQELTNDDFGVLYYEGLEIDLSDLIREAILLGLPSYPTCGDSEDECQNKAEIEAILARESDEDDEEDTGVDPRWAALSALKAKMDKPN